ncbi:hypothetical protein H9P43_008089 [Blastocladiella emersonii ATCC 22665]|nr:hypothetical protein H9P43_008089 [Blastocladiella emersonii ATCC 22665]
MTSATTAPAILSLPSLHSHTATVAGSAPAPPASLTARVSLVAALSILDHWAHRNEGSTRVVGALLGTRSADGSVLDITDSFPIALVDNDTSIDVSFATTMYQLRRRTNAKDLVLGWYTTGAALDESSAGFHEWFEENLISTSHGFHQGVHLLVDASLNDDNMALQGFIGVPVATLTDGKQGRMFVPFPVEVAVAEHEQSGLEAIASAALPSSENVAPLVPRVGIPQAQGRVAKLDSLLDACIHVASETLDELRDTKRPLSGPQAAALNRLGHTLAKVVAARTHAADVRAMDAEIRDLKTILELAAQARKQMVVSELIMYGAAFKH